jgi:phosphoglycerol transferase MdoB-like AlkP superfamily enzyme
MCSFLIVLLIQRRAFIVLLISTLWIACGITNCSLMFLRALPFTARDIFLVYDGLKVAKAYFNITEIILIASGVAVVLLLLAVSFFKLPKCRKPPKYSRQIITIASLVLILVFITTVGTGDIALASDNENINAAYDDCGFAFCFASSIFDSGIGKPDDYAQDKMEALKAQLDAIPDSSGKKPNIIYIQLESFFDPSTINGLNYSENPIPVFTRLKQDFPSVFLSVPSLGAGTVNTEFEILTV